MDHEEILAFLRRNNRSETHIVIPLLDFSDDVRSLSEALQANDHVNSITWYFGGFANRNINWNPLLRVIATRENLENVYLTDAVDVGRRNPSDRIVPFLLAIQQNPRVKIMSFSFLQLSGD
jgi:hypothetical protein